jgi:tetratricopeptide (TPR) repeat protein
MVGDLKKKVVLLLIVLALLCMTASGQTTAVDWDNKSVLDVSVLDHSMATGIDESAKTAISRTQEFSVNDSKSYFWLSLGNVGAGTVYWNWYSPAGQILCMDSMQIPMPTSGSSWNTYNIWSSIDIAGKNASNLPGDWHVDVFLNGRKMLTEYFSISEGQKTTAPENQYQYNLTKSDETAYKNLYNQNKYYLSITKGDKLKGEGRYDEAIYFYDEAINLNPNTFQNWKVWNSKGEALSKQGKYAEAIQAYDKAIELVPDVSIVWTNKGYALKALGRTNESDIAYATARELGDYSAWVPKTNATGINLTSLYFIEILDHCMANDVDKSTNDVITRTNTFSSTDSKIYSWLKLGHVLGATVTWHWYSPDGNPYRTGQVNIERNPKGSYWPSYNVWYSLDVADIPKEQYMSGNWHVDVYINGKKRLTEQFDLKIGSGTATISHSATPGSGATNGTFTLLDHCMASEIDEATSKPVTTTKTNKVKDTLVPYSWLQLGNIGAARIEWDWKGGEYTNNGKNYEITHTYNIPPNPKGGYYASYNVWDFIDIPGMLQDFETGESNVWEARRSAEEGGYSYHGTNPNPDPRGDWTVDVYVNDQWLLQEQFTVVSG